MFSLNQWKGTIFYFVLISRNISNVTITAIDEHVNVYAPTSSIKSRAENNGSPIPVVFIPCKPHPNGLMEYLMVTSLPNPSRINAKVPVVLDILPHVKVGDSAPRDVIKTFMER